MYRNDTEGITGSKGDALDPVRGHGPALPATAGRKTRRTTI
jgi:hypothetical protein